jgi:hypothetical protein
VATALSLVAAALNLICPQVRMNNPDHISYSLQTIFLVKILKFLDVDPGSGLETIWIQDPRMEKSQIRYPE